MKEAGVIDCSGQEPLRVLISFLILREEEHV